jgi:trimeric autotransporter adhesin
MQNLGLVRLRLHKEMAMKPSNLRFLIVAAVCACASLPLAAQSAPASLSASRIVAPIDETRLVSLKGNVHPLAQARFDRGAAPGQTATGRVILEFQRSPEQQLALAQFLQDLQNAGSPNFHKWLTPAQYGAQFGLDDADLQTVSSWLQSHGFKIENVPAARNIIQFSGTFDQIQQTFHTAIHSYLIDGQSHFANVTDPQIPAALAPVIAAVGPFNDFRPRSTAVRGPSGKWDAAHHAITPEFTIQNDGFSTLYVDPADAATIYDTPNKNLNGNFSGTTSYDGTGVTIGIVGDGDITLQDITNYRTGFLGETTANVNLPSIVIPGDDPGVNGDSIEGLLDVEVAGGIAPGAKIDFYTAADTPFAPGLFLALARAIDDNTVSIVNMSFGVCERTAGADNPEMFEFFQQASAQGISVTVSSGDSGSAGCDVSDTEEVALEGLGVNGLGSTPWNISVGGTDFDALPANFDTYVTDVSQGTAPYYRTAKGYIPENPWNNSTLNNTLIADNTFPTPPLPTNIVAGGGGSSILYPKPWFQTALTPQDGTRDLPDVSLFAANGAYGAVWVICSDSISDGDGASYFSDCQNTGGAFASGATFAGVGGTSASSPAFAGMLALIEQAQGGRLGQADGVLYSVAQSSYASAFNDITVGNNSVYCTNNSPDCLTINSTLGYYSESGFQSGPGYDLASGLGSVDLSNLIRLWNNNPLAATTTKLDINGGTAAINVKHGTNLTFSVGVTPSSATGSVAVVDPTGGLFTIPLTTGAGTGTYNGLPGGTYNVTARYSGDANNASSTSGPISVTISAEPSTTALSVDAYGISGPSATFANTAIPYGSYVFANAQIMGTAQGANTQGAATGTVEFLDNGTALNSENIGLNNTATYPPLNNNYPLFTVGAHSITAKYSGDTSFNASNSSAATFTIVKAPTTTAALATPQTVNSETSSYVSVTLTTPLNLGKVPTGTITLTTGSTTLATISNYTVNPQYVALGEYILTGAATLQASQLPSGASTITATYSGDAHYAASSSTFSVTNTNGLGAFSLSNSGSIALNPGQSGNTTVTVTPSGGFNGPVTFTCSAASGLTCSVPAPVNVSAATVPAMIAVAAASSVASGTYPVTVTGTDGTGKTTASTTFNVVVTALPPPVPSFTLSNSGPIAVPGGATSNNLAMLTLTPANGYLGTANLTCTVTTAIANPVSMPTCAGSAVTVASALAVSFTVQVSTTATTSPGAYTINVVATDSTTASITAGTSFGLTVDAPPIVVSTSGSISLNPGAASGNTATITITPANGFTGMVNLSCKLTAQPANAVSLPTCALPGSVSITGTNPATATMTITTTAAGNTSAATPPLRDFLLGGGATLAMIFFFGVPARRRAWRTLFGLLVVIVTMAGIGCGSVANQNHGTGPVVAATTAGNYTFTITAVDATTELQGSSTTITITVN